jgi:beta-glucosidase
MKRNFVRFLPSLLLSAAVCLTALPGSLQAADDNTAVKPVPRGGNWMKRHEAINKRVAQGDVDLIFIGDSITDAWDGAGRKVWEHYYGDRNAVNAGIGGDRTQHVLWRLQHGNIKGISPKLAVIMIGTNNAGSNTSEEIAEGVTAIVDYLQKETPKTKILLLGIFPRGATPADQRRQVNEGANKIIAKLDQREGVVYQDIGDVFTDEQGNLSREVMPDLLHLNAASYQKWAEAIEPNVSKLMGDKPVSPPKKAAAGK